MYIVCPNCGEVSEVDEKPAIGQHVLCPFCDNKFAYGKSASATKSKRSKQQTDMKCPSCGMKYEVDDSKTGQEVECKACGRKFVIGDKRKPTVEIDYEGNKEYFFYNRTKEGYRAGCLCVVCAFFVIHIGSFLAIKASVPAPVLFWLGVVALGIVWHYRKNLIDKVFTQPQLPSDEDIDMQARRIGNSLDGKAMDKLGIAPDEVSMVEPIRLWGYRFVYPCMLGDAADAAAHWITGKDGKKRSSEVTHTVFYFGEHSVYCYVHTASLVNGNVTNDRTEEYFYRDIVSLKTESKIAKRKKESFRVDVFVLVNTGGERLECEVENKTEADTVARAFRTLLKQKKF